MKVSDNKVKQLSRKAQRQRAFEALGRKDLRKIAKGLGITQGRNKADTVKHLLAADHKLTITVAITLLA